MGKWSTYQLRGGGQGATAPLVAPFLSGDGAGNLNWTWTDADPDHWDIELSATGGAPWTVIDTQAGAARTAPDEVPSSFFRIIGRDAGGVAVTLYSNIYAS